MDEEDELTSEPTGKGVSIVLPRYTGNFRQQIYEPLMQQASQTNTETNKHGMMHLLVGSQEQWTAIGGEGGLPAPQAKPDMVAVDATASNRRTYQRKQKLYTQEQEFRVAALKETQRVLGLQFAQFCNRDTRLPNKTIAEVIAFMLPRHDAASAVEDVARCHETLNGSLTATTTFAFDTWWAGFDDALRRLADKGEAVPRGMQVEFAVKAFADFPGLLELTEEFFRIKPKQSDQTMQAMIEYITPQLGRVSLKTVGKIMGTTGSANAAAAADILVLTARVKELEVALARAGGGQHTAGGGTPTIERKRAYCFKHGYCWHSGSVCTELAASGTREQQKARSPTDVPGGSVKRN